MITVFTIGCDEGSVKEEAEVTDCLSLTYFIMLLSFV